MREAGFLIVKDPEDLPLANRKHAVPGVVGSNIFNVLANNPDDFDKNETPVATEILSLYNQEIFQDKGRTGFAKVGGPIVIPGRSLKQINVDVPPPPSKSGPYEAIIERHSCIVNNFPNGVAVGRLLVTVVKYRFKWQT